MRNFLGRIALMLGGMAVILGATSIGSLSSCDPTDCKAQCPMHEAQRANPEPPKSCCDKKEKAPVPTIRKCKADSNKSVPVALVAFVKFRFACFGPPSNFKESKNVKHNSRFFGVGA